jgi:hypothetical protein
MLYRISTFLATIAVVTLMLTAAHAEVVTLKASLSGKNEAPPSNSTASGTAEAALDTATKELTYTVTFSGLSGPVVGAHFHGPSEAGKNAGIVLPFKMLESPIKGTATLTASQTADLLAGKWYANIHTAANPGGEIRGQMKR